MARAGKLPWDSNISNHLAGTGIEFTGRIICDYEYNGRIFMTVREAVICGLRSIWVRALNCGLAPSNYVQKMIPEGIKLDELRATHVVPVDDMMVLGDENKWIFVISQSYVTTMALDVTTNEIKKERFKQIISGLTSLHSYGYIHGDLCPENIWIDEDGNINLSGYSLATISDFSQLSFEDYHSKYRQPNHGESIAGDVYALGVIMLELLSGEQIEINTDIIFRVKDNGNLSISAKDLLVSMLNPNEKDRALMGWIASHDYFIEPDDEPEQEAVPLISNEPIAGPSKSPLKKRMKIDERVEAICDEKGVRVESFLGKGCYGAVYRVEYNKEYLAMKLIYTEQAVADVAADAFNFVDKEMLENLENEEKIIIRLIQESDNCKFIIKMVDFFKIPNVVNIVLMEVAPTDLQKEIDKFSAEESPSLINEASRNIKKWLHEFSQGLEFLHSINISHFDVKADNCLIRTDNTAAVADFGLSHFTEEGSPRQIEDYRDDVRMFGFCVEDCMKALSQMALRGMPKGEAVTPPSARAFIDWCTQRRPNPPITMTNIVDHDWFKEDLSEIGKKELYAVIKSRARSNTQSPAVLRKTKRGRK